MASSREERLARRIEQRVVRATMQTFSGPLPPPSMLAEYNDVINSGAERIMAMAEKQQQHRQALETRVVNSNTFDQRLGLVLGFIVMMSVAGAGVWLISSGRDASGATALVTAVAGPVVAFIYGRKRQEADRADKR